MTLSQVIEKRHLIETFFVQYMLSNSISLIINHFGMQIYKFYMNLTSLVNQKGFLILS
jgi:hypothetical protein